MVTYMVGLEPSKIISFNFGEDSSVIVLSNYQNLQNVCYKIKTTAPSLYSVKPFQGTMAPGMSVKIQINILPGTVK